MKAIQRIRRASAWGLSALALSTLLLCSVACTRGNHQTPGDTTAGTSSGTPAVTTPASGNHGTGTTRPLDPDAGTVDTGSNAGDPPTGTDGGHESRSFTKGFMH